MITDRVRIELAPHGATLTAGPPPDNASGAPVTTVTEAPERVDPERELSP
jgi:hypothetical protein